MSKWISIKDKLPETKEPVVYIKPHPRKRGEWHVGIAYWTVSRKWLPARESTKAPDGFTHWMPLPEPPTPSPGLIHAT